MHSFLYTEETESRGKRKLSYTKKKMLKMMMANK